MDINNLKISTVFKCSDKYYKIIEEDTKKFPCTLCAFNDGTKYAKCINKEASKYCRHSYIISKGLKENIKLNFIRVTRTDYIEYLTKKAESEPTKARKIGEIFKYGNNYLMICKTRNFACNGCMFSGSVNKLNIPCSKPVLLNAIVGCSITEGNAKIGISFSKSNREDYIAYLENHNKTSLDGMQMELNSIATSKSSSDNIEEHVNPKHYKSHPSGVECIEIARHYCFSIGNVFKYIWRAGLKKDEGLEDIDKEIEDLEKARWYLNDRITELKNRKKCIK